MSKFEVDAYEARRRAAMTTDAAPEGWDDAPWKGKEGGLHGQIKKEVHKRDWIAFSGRMDKVTGRKLGEPDFTILADGGRVFLIECKAGKGKLSLDQEGVKAHAAKLGHTVHVVRSFYQFLKIIDQK